MTTGMAFIKKHSVLIYFLLTFIISWGGALLAVGGLRGLPATTEESTRLLPFIVLGTLAGPSLGGILLTSLVYGRSGLRELLARFGRRVGGRWYLVALLTAPVVVSAILLVLSLLSPKYLPSIMTTGDKTGLLLTGITYGLAAGFFEELGWTGFALPELRQRYPALITGLWIGLAWGLWHFFVAVWGSGDSSGAFSWALFLPWIAWNLAVLPVFRVLMVWVYEHTDSLLIGMLMHASLTASLPLILMPAVSGVELSGFYLILAVALGLVVVLVTNSKGGQFSRQPLQRRMNWKPVDWVWVGWFSSRCWSGAPGANLRRYSMNLRTLLMVGAILTVPAFAQDQWPPPGWRTSTPEEQGIDSAKLAEGLQLMRQRGLDIHSFLMIHNGYVVVDAYFYPYDGKTVHEVASVSKSLMTTLIGIAIDQGKLKLDDKMLSFFPDRIVANRDALKEKITVQHLASMSSGLECTAQNDEQTLQEMKASPDWVQFTLDRKVVWEPGSHFEYCSPAIHLLSPILQKATGMTAVEFAKKYLFDPLGIKNVLWVTDPQGYNRGSEGAYLLPGDMAKLGYLWLNKGIWEGKQIVSRQWVEDSVKVQMKTGGGDNYGYGWWIATDEPAAYNAIGRGGQRIIVVPGWNLIIVTTGGGFNFDQIEPWVRSVLGDINKSLPANADGVAKLKAVVSAVVQPPAPKAVSLPQTAKTISGKTLVFGANPYSWETMRLVFGDTAEATIHLKLKGTDMVTWPVALDGVYRFVAGLNGLPMGLRGSWVDDKTFVVEYDNIGNNDHILLRFRFEGERVMVQAQETDHETGATVEGRIVNP